MDTEARAQSSSTLLSKNKSGDNLYSMNTGTTTFDMSRSTGNSGHRDTLEQRPVFDSETIIEEVGREAEGSQEN